MTSQTLVKFNDLSLPNPPGMIERAVNTVLHYGQFILGDEVEHFELALRLSEFKDYAGQRGEMVGVGSGTDALKIAFYALLESKRWNPYPRDIVIVSVANSAPATLTPFIQRDFQIRYCDVDASGLMDLSSLKKTLSSIVRGSDGYPKIVIIPVDLYGQPCNIQQIKVVANQICPDRHIIIQDAAQSIGVPKWRSVPDAICYSFYPTKNLGALGDAGAIYLDTHPAQIARSLRMYGYTKDKSHTQERFGFNSRLDELQAAILSAKLVRLEEMNNLRKDIAQKYNAGLKDTIKLDYDPQGNYHIYPITVKNRDEVREELSLAGIQTAVHYPIPQYAQAGRFDVQGYEEELTMTNYLCDHELSLPIWPGMSELEIRYVIDQVNKAVAS